ncbi:MAG: 2Fe-2S iron-sulfur cluster-binding protein [Mangrovicoccus sp.]
MANVTFSSPTMAQDKTVYAIAGNTKTVLGLAEEFNIPIPFECKDGECGSCLIEVDYFEPSTKMGQTLTEKEKDKLRSLGVISKEEIENAEVNDLPPRYRLACQFVARDEDVRISFTGDPGGA